MESVWNRGGEYETMSLWSVLGWNFLVWRGLGGGETGEWAPGFSVLDRVKLVRRCLLPGTCVGS